ncbi:MAG: hypothetical protein FWD23_16630, partial [Oscillospiraceae bacterium]|nr:hypothetical protein [Oscillospiraceae bacterium]
MKNAIKTICAILIFSMVFVTFACNAAQNSNTESTSDNQNADNTEAENKPAAEADIPFPHEVINLGGATF